jgi:Na+/H+ antiporter NhaD/arsenite permease-like protein
VVLGETVLVVAIFVVGYVAIVLEHLLKVNKSAAALLAGVLCWTAYAIGGDAHIANEQLQHHLGGLSQILFFLLTAMTIVELIDAHDGFELLTSRVKTTNRRRLLVTIAALTFFLSAVLDNLTTAILMSSLVRKLVPDPDDRMSYGGVVVIAANSGGVWSPIGDVTTTMLWVGQQITTTSIITRLLLPALVSVILPTLWIGRRMKGHLHRLGTARAPQASISDAPGRAGLTLLTLPSDAAAVGRSLGALNLRARTGASVVSIARGEDEAVSPSPLEPLRDGDELSLAGAPDAIARAVDLLMSGQAPKPTTAFERAVVLATGMGVLLLVPAFKTITHLPPMMGIVLGLGILWLVTEIIHKRRDDEGRGALTVAGALSRIDAQSVLFFLGILLAISALESAGTLATLARWLDHAIGNVKLMTVLIGLASSVVDNVPLVAAAQGMYPLTTFPRDHEFWLFLAYCAGTGGSILIIGSAAGIAVMGIERISFGAYMRKMSLPALVGYLGGAGAYLATQLFSP